MNCLFKSLLLLVLSQSAFAAWNDFHTVITELSPPYKCQTLMLRGASGFPDGAKHIYYFSGICAVKIPTGTTWIYQDVWTDLTGEWDVDTHTAKEFATFSPTGETLTITLRCENDPWITKAQCAVTGLDNQTSFINFSRIYEFNTGQYPPLARNLTTLREATLLALRAQEPLSIRTIGPPVRHRFRRKIRRVRCRTIMCPYERDTCPNLPIDQWGNLRGQICHPNCH